MGRTLSRLKGVVALNLLVSACGGDSTAGKKLPAPALERGASAEGGSVARGGAHTTGGNRNSGSDAGTQSGTAGAGNARPPSHGAVSFTVSALSPPRTGRACPATAFTVELPDEDPSAPEGPTATSYTDHLVDGENGASVACKVAGAEMFAFEAAASSNNRGFSVTQGVLDEGGRGTAQIRIIDQAHLSNELMSNEPCTIDVSVPPLQVTPGAIWAGFSCPALASPPTSLCRSSGYFVFENCEQ